MNTEVGNSWVSYTIQRGPIVGPHSKSVGIRLTVKAKPELESFMQTLSKDRKEPVLDYGELWASLSNTPLEVYRIEEPLGPSSRNGYNITSIGMGLLLPSNNRDLRGELDSYIPNLSILKLVGISKPDGVSIGIYGAFSASYVNSLTQCLPRGTDQFLRDFLVPMTINLHMVSSKE